MGLPLVFIDLSRTGIDHRGFETLKRRGIVQKRDNIALFYSVVFHCTHVSDE